MKTVFDLKSIFIALVFCCMFCNYSLAQQIVTITMEDGNRITNHQLVDKDDSRFGDVTVVFSKISKKNDEYSFNMEFQLRGIGSGNRLFITDKNLDQNELSSTLRSINASYSIDRNFMRLIREGQVSVWPFYNNVAPRNAISLINTFDSGGHVFNRGSRNSDFSINKDLILQNEYKINFNLQFYLIEGDQLTKALKPIPIQITFEGLDTPVEPMVAEVTADSTKKPDDKIKPDEIANPCDELHIRLNNQLRGIRSQITRFENRINTLDENIQVIEIEVPENGNLTSERREELFSEVVEYRNQNTALLEGMRRTEQSIQRIQRAALDDQCKDDQNMRLLQTSIENDLRRLNGFQSRFSGFSFGSRMDMLEGQLDEDFAKTRDELRARFGSDIKELTVYFAAIENRFKKFREEFDRTKTSPWYFRSDSTGFYNRFQVYQNEFDSIVHLFEQNEQDAKDEFSERLRGAQPSYEEETENKRQRILTTRNNIEQWMPLIGKDFKEFPPRDFPWLLAGIAGLIALLLIFGLIVFIRGIRQRRKVEKKLRKQTVVEHITNGDKKVGGLKIAQVQKDYIPGKGLSHVYEKIDRDYYEIDMRTIWQETTVSRVFINRELIKTIYRFFYNSLAEDGKVKEHGGYILGAWDFNKDDETRYDVSLEYFIETRDDAINENYELNFGAKIGLRVPEEIRKIKEKSGINLSLIGWIHSHPEISIFLSQSDLNVQQTLSGKDYKHKLIALVLDPNTQDNGKIAFNTGIFSYRNEHGMNNIGNGGIHLIKWRDLYDWARTPVPPDMSNNYKIDIKEIINKSIVSNIYLKDKCIIRLSHFLDDIQEKDFASGIFTGQVLNKNFENNHMIILNDFEGNTHKPSSMEFPLVGYFLYGKNKSSMIQKMIHDIEKVKDVQLLVICDNDEKNLLLLTRKENGEFISIDDAEKRVSFYEIETWPTRKR